MRHKTMAEIEAGLTAHIEAWAGWPVHVQEYHHERMIEQPDTDYPYDVDPLVIESHMDGMKPGSHFTVADPDSDAVWIVCLDLCGDWRYTPADGRTRMGATRGEVLSELFPNG